MALKTAFGLAVLAELITLPTLFEAQTEIWRPILFLSAPALSIGISLLRPRWWTIIPATGVVWLIVILVAASAGLLYLPSALAVTIAAFQTAFGPRGPRRAS